MRAVGIDIGGTKIQGALVEGTKIIKEVTLPTGTVRKETLRNLHTVVSQLVRSGVQGIGIGYPGVVAEGKIIFHGCLPSFKGVNLAAEVRKNHNLPVYVGNDANCFALAESRYGAGKGIKNMVGLIIGTGVGCGIVLDGKLWSGEYGAAGEIGHTVIDPASDIECLCREGKGHLAGLVGGPGIVTRYQRRGGKMADPAPDKIFASKEPAAIQTLEDTYRYIGIGVSQLVNALDVSLIVLGGGISHLPKTFYQKSEQAINFYTCRVQGRKVKLVKHQLPEMNAGVIGAAALVR